MMGDGVVMEGVLSFFFGVRVREFWNMTRLGEFIMFNQTTRGSVRIKRSGASPVGKRGGAPVPFSPICLVISYRMATSVQAPSESGSAKEKAYAVSDPSGLIRRSATLTPYTCSA